MIRFVDEQWETTGRSTAKKCETGDDVEGNLSAPKTAIQSFAPLFRIALRRARLERRMTTAELAQRVRITDQSMRSYEAGSEFPSADLITRFEKLLEIQLVPMQTHTLDVR